ncbi:hypothetical protein D3C87_1750220 [compost metagenome]
MENTDSSLAMSGMANALFLRMRTSSMRPPMRLSVSGATLMSIQKSSPQPDAVASERIWASLKTAAQ